MGKEKPILTISVAASLLGLHPRTLMLYENVGLISPHRTESNRRLFSQKDLEELQFIKFLTRKEGINLQGVRFMQEAIGLGEKEGIKLKKLLFPSFRPRSLV